MIAEPTYRPRNRFRTEHRHPTVPRLGHVSSLERCAEDVIRVVLRCGELGAFEVDGQPFPAMTSTGFDDVIVLCFPNPPGGQVQHPRLRPDIKALSRGSSLWTAREYTVRRYVPERNEIVIDFMLHETGIADSWVRAARVGDQLGFFSPRMCRGLPAEPQLIAIGDATALPAICRLLDEAPTATTLDVYLIVDRSANEAIVPARSDISVKWIDPRSSPLGALRAQLVKNPPLPEESWAWVAGESELVAAIRRILVHEHAMERERIQFTGYWKTGMPSQH